MDTVAQLTEIRDRLTAIIDAMKPPMTGGMDAAPNPGSGTPQGSNPTMGPIPPRAEAGNPAFPGSPVDGTAGNPASLPDGGQAPNPIAAIMAQIVPAAMPAPPADVVPLPPPPPPAAAQAPAQAPAQPFSVGGPESGNPTSYGQGRRGTYRRKLSRKRTAKK